MIARRGLFAGLGALLAAPAIIRTPGLLMPVKAPLVGSAPNLTFADGGIVHWNASLGKMVIQNNTFTDVIVWPSAGGLSMVLPPGGTVVGNGEEWTVA